MSRSEVSGSATQPLFFATAEALRAWFAQHHASEKEMHAGFYKIGSGRESITWPESVDEALCVGWIDGVRRSLGAESYAIRFTPRRSVSIWSAVNISRVEALTAEGRMQAAGLRAFATRSDKRSRIYAYEQPGRREHLAAQPTDLSEPYAGRLRENPAAAAFFQRQSPSCRKKWINWVLNAKAEETRLRRLEKLIMACAAGKSV